MKMMHRLAAAAMTAAMILSLAACGSKPAPAPAAPAETKAAETEAPAETGELREMNVVLDWYPNALHTFIYTAIERGYYAEEGLDVKIQFPSNTNDALSLVAAGRAEIGLYYQQDVIQAVANAGTPIKSIGAVVQTPLNIILSLKDENITRPKDMENKTVGYAGTVLSEALVKCMVEADGGSYDSITMTDVGFDLMSSMTTGNVNATIGCLVNHEVPEMIEEGFEVNYFMVDSYGVPTYYEEIFVANDKMLAEEPEVIKAFLRASAKGFRDFQEDPYGTLDILLNNQNEENFPLTPSVEQASCDMLLPLMDTAEMGFLDQKEESWQANIDWMLENDLIDRPVEVSDVMVHVDFE